MKQGVILALGAYLFWGLHPIYWKLLQHVPSVEIVSHRIFWSLVFFALISSCGKRWQTLIAKIKKNRHKSILYIPALLIGSNWAMYIWAVNAGYIIEASLGYFISPLINVFLGVIILKEKLRKTQLLAVLIAATGVLVMTLLYGQFPWISLYLAGTWATYGLLRKKSPLSSVEGLTLETAVLSVPILFYLLFLTGSGQGSFLISLSTTLLLIGAGITSGFPLLIFIKGARLIPLSLIGILQYIYPTLIFIVGAFIYHEHLSQAKMVGFIFIWVALIIYSLESYLFSKKKIKPNPASPIHPGTKSYKQLNCLD
jgi:chloramphenicol-sensitive protein RarD